MKRKEIAKKIIDVIASQPFFYGILAVLFLQATWFALSAQYPMAFDENFHFGLIRVYAEQWSPLVASAPGDSGEFGALTRDPSYLYHYIMSFPYRIIAAFTSSQEIQVIILRFLNIGIFLAGMIFFRKLLLRAKASPALVHFALLVFSLIPVVPMLAAHINYDNLVFLLVPIVALMTVRCGHYITRNNTLASGYLIGLFVLCLFTGLVKYAFLPIFLALFVYLGILIISKPTAQRRATLKSFVPDFQRHSLPLKVFLIGGVLIGGVFFAERYAVNIVHYQMVVPNCEKVRDFAFCSQYSPWIRNYTLAAEKDGPADPNLVAFTGNWFYGMMYRLFFAINAEYVTRPPLPLPITAAYAVALGGILLALVYAKKLLLRNKVLFLFMAIVAIYGVTMFTRNYSSYLQLGEMVAINGRYFIPLMPLILIIIGLAFRQCFGLFKTHATSMKIAVSIVAVLLLLQGGGVMTYIIQSDRSWHWPNQLVRDINHTAQTVLNAVTIGGR